MAGGDDAGEDIDALLLDAARQVFVADPPVLRDDPVRGTVATVGLLFRERGPELVGGQEPEADQHATEKQREVWRR